MPPNHSGGADGFPAPPEWFGGVSLGVDEFIRLVHSFKARFRASVARTPVERAAVNWDAVIQDAQGGITSDVVVTIGGAYGWDGGFAVDVMHDDASWSQLSPFYWGFADAKAVHPNSDGYEGWLMKSLPQRAAFLVITPDLRWPDGYTRAQQQAASTGTPDYTSRPYVSNRSVADPPGAPWGTSYYDYSRYRYLSASGSSGPWPELLRAEFDLLAAEGYIRKGQLAQAATLIDRTRVTNGRLPALSGAITSQNDPVPGGAFCVPQVPAGSNGPTACGNAFEALKYEKRVEVAFNFMGAWFWDSRGWGDLVLDTPLFYPVPYEELSARGHPPYNTGGDGYGSALLGTYKFP
jgi:hypothetical protein